MINKFRAAALFLLVILISGCALVYTSPQVIGSDPDLNVEEIDITLQVMQVANQSAYEPPSLPASFDETASGALRGASGAIPAPPLQNPPAANNARLILPSATAPRPYTIGIGDKVSIRGNVIGPSGGQAGGIIQNTFTVQSDGTVDLPGIGPISLAGVTINEANAALRQVLVAQRIDPDFSIQVEEFNSQRISFGGAVSTPQVIQLGLAPLYLEEALAIVGGPASNADDAVIQLYRNGSLFQIPVAGLFNRTLERILLLDGDSLFLNPGFDLQAAQDFFQQQINVNQLRAANRATALNELQVAVSMARARNEESRSNFERQIQLGDDLRPLIFVAGEVTNPRTISMPFGRDMFLAEALLSEGGISIETGDFAQIYVLRRADDGRSLQAYRLDASNALNLVLAAEFELRPSDIDFVAEQRITRWNRALTQSVPSVFTSAAGGI